MKYYHYDYGCIPEDISEIDILYKEANNPNVFVVKTLKRSDNINIWPGDNTNQNLVQDIPRRGNFMVSTDMIHAAVPSNQLLRPWDNVPRYALAQEVSANRLIYGNYVQNYTVEQDPIISVGLRYEPVTDINTSYAQPSIKCLRTYQLGITYSDRYGRETPILTGVGMSGQGNTLTVFKPACATRNRFTASLDKTSVVPDWAEYMTWYIKETSTEYYNMASDRWYAAEDGNAWLSFNSADRNKLDEEDFIELKKAHGTNEAITQPARYKVLAIENEAPDEIRTTRRSLGILPDNDSIGNSAGFGVPTQGFNFFLVDEGQWSQVFGEEIGMVSGTTSLVFHGNGGNNRSNEYRVNSIIFDAGVGFTKVVTQEEFGPDIAFINDDLGDLGIELFELNKENLPEFDGRFFVKINRDTLLETYLGGGADNLDESQLILYLEHNIGYLNNNGYSNLGAGGTIPNEPHHRHLGGTLDGPGAYSSDSEFSWHPTVRAGNYADAGVNHYRWANAPQTGANSYNAVHNVAATQIDEDPCRILNDSSGFLWNDSAWFWQDIADECINRQALFIDACTAFDLTSHSDAKPDTEYGNQWNWDGQGGGGADAHDNASYHWGDMPGNMKTGKGQPSRGIWYGDHIIDLSWSGMGEGYINSHDENSGPYDHIVDAVDLESHEIVAEFMKELVQVGTMFKFKREPANGGNPGADSLYIVQSFAGLDYFGYGNSDVWESDHTWSNHGAYGIRNQKEGGSQPSRKQYRGWNMRQRWSILVDRPIGSGQYGYNPIKGTDPDQAGNDPGVNGDFGMPTPGSQAEDAVWSWNSSKRARLPLTHDFANTNTYYPQLDAIQIYKRIDDLAVNKGHFTTNPAVWETIPKKAVELDIYYQASGMIPLVTTDRTNEELIPIGSTIVAEGNEYIVESWSDDTTIKLTTNLLTIVGDGAVIKVKKRNHYEFNNYTSAIALAGQPYVALHGGVQTTLNALKNHTQTHILDWGNCWAFGNGIESDRIRDDFNAAQVDNGVKASSGIGHQLLEERRKHGLIWSGIYNSNAGINDTNQFIMAEGITKDLNPVYGSIQALLNRNTRLIMFCEDKILRAVTNRDALYNADGNPQLVASNAVIGDVQAYQGQFGIATNPESMAENPYAVYFTDAMRGKVLRLTSEGIVPISDSGMKDYFADLMRDNAWRCLGTFDQRKNEYNLTVSKKYTKTQALSHETKTITYNDSAKGWASFKSFIPQHGATINNNYYTFSGGQLYKHHDETELTYYSSGASSANLTMTTVVGLEAGMLVEGTGIVEGSTISSISGNVVTINNAVTSLFIPQDIIFNTPHNTFYGTYYDSDITSVFNDQKSSIKSFNTINYEGTQARIDEWDSVSANRLTNTYATNDGLLSSNIDDEEYYNLDPKNGWYADSVITDLQSCGNLFFKDKEGKYFGYPTGDTTTLSNLDEKEFSVQGLGNATMAHDTDGYGGEVTIRVTNNTSSTYQGSDGSGGAWDSASVIADETSKWSATIGSKVVTGGATIGSTGETLQFTLSPIINGVYSGTPLAAANLELSGATNTSGTTWGHDGTTNADPDDDNTIAAVSFADSGVAGDPSNEITVTVTFANGDTYPTSDTMWYIDIDEKAVHVADTDPELRDVAFKMYWDFYNTDTQNAVTPHNIGADAGEANVTETQLASGGVNAPTKWKFVGNNIIDSDVSTLVAEVPFSLVGNNHYATDPVAVKSNMGLYNQFYTVEFPEDLKVYTNNNLTGFTARVYYTASSDPVVFPDPPDGELLDLDHLITIVYDIKATHSGMTDTITDVTYPPTIPKSGGSTGVIVRGIAGAKYRLNIEQKSSTTSDITAADGYYYHETNSFGTTMDVTEYTIPSSGIYRHWFIAPETSRSVDTRYDVTVSPVGTTSATTNVPRLTGDASITQYGNRILSISATTFNGSRYTSAGTTFTVQRPRRYEGDNYPPSKAPKIIRARAGNGGVSKALITLEKTNQAITPGMLVICDGTYDTSGADSHTPTITHGTTVSSIDGRYITLSVSHAVADGTLIEFINPSDVLAFALQITPNSNTLTLTNDVVLVNEIGSDSGVAILTNGIVNDSITVVLDNIKGINIGDTAYDSYGNTLGVVATLASATSVTLDTSVTLADDATIMFTNNSSFRLLNASKVKIGNDIFIRGHILPVEINDNLTIPILIDNVITAS